MSTEKKLATQKSLGRRVGMWTLMAALIVVVALSAGCSNKDESKDTANKGKEDVSQEYKQSVQNCIDQYAEAYQTYSNQIVAGFGDYEASSKLTKEDIASIKKTSDEFSETAVAALDRMETLKAPEEFKDVQEKITAYAKAMKEIGVPAVVGPLSAMKEGETLEQFSSKDGQPTEQQAARMKRANAEFVAALKKLDINVGGDESAESSTTP